MLPRPLSLSPVLLALAFLGTSSLVHGLQCRFKLPPYTYDLCPLIFMSDSMQLSENPSSRSIHVEHKESTPPTVMRYAYDIDLGGSGLKKDGTLPAKEQCPNGTWICLQISNIRPDHPSEPGRILQVIPISGNIVESNEFNEDTSPERARAPRSSRVNATARWYRRATDQPPSLIVTLNGGSYRSQPYRAVLRLHCDKSVSEPSTPVPDFFLHDPSSHSKYTDTPEYHTHGFAWRTPHACPVARDAEPPHPTHSHVASPLPHKPHDGDEEDGDEESVVPGIPLSDESPTNVARKAKTSGIVIGCIVVIALLFYGTYILRMQRRKRPYASLSTDHTTSSPFPFTLPPLPSLPFAMPRFLRPRQSARRHANLRSRPGSAYAYDPLSAEEYEIQDDGEEGGSAVVDFQTQGLLEGRKTAGAGETGYGTVR